MLIRSIAPCATARRATPLRRGVNSALDEFWSHLDSAPVSRAAAFVPPIDISDSPDALRFTVEVPGLDESEFEVTVEADLLTIKGEKQVSKVDDSERIVRSESSGGAFTRSFRLPFEADPDSVSGALRNGVLTVTIPKPESPRTRSVPISTG